MLRIASFNPIESINARLKPWGFAVSTKQQMVSKIAFASLSMLTIHEALRTVEGCREGVWNNPGAQCHTYGESSIWCEPSRACSKYCLIPTCRCE